MTYEITEYQQTAAAIAILREKHAGPFDTTTKDGMNTAKEARAEVRGYRVSVEKLRTEALQMAYDIGFEAGLKAAQPLT